ncbi:MAG: histidine phosphatase family protein [Chloroflexi bacterium]|nr:histidine phosphatase family protein [Chloroflexota bacterium]
MNDEPIPAAGRTLPPTATTLLLVRHAETVDNAGLRLSGWTDAAISDHGLKQVAAVAEHFNREHGHVSALYSSPLQRARITAEAIGDLTGHTPILLDDLREMYFGDLDGKSFEELREAYQDILQADEDIEQEDFVWPNGESRSGFSERVERVIDAIARRHPGEAIGVITHGGIIAVFMTLLYHESGALWRKWTVPNASLTEVVWDPVSRQGQLVRHGDAGHLEHLTPPSAAEDAMIQTAVSTPET